MKKRFIIVLLVFLLCLMGCTQSESSSFKIIFIDVGQGDAALVLCDGQAMLIDGGDVTAGKTIYDTLENEGDGKAIRQLDYLVISHLHQDHYAGLIEGLKNITTIGLTLSNKSESSNLAFKQFEQELGKVNGKGSKITVPHVDEEFELGSARIQILDVSAEEENDSLVLLITYKNTTFLFTGDIEYSGQKRLVEKYAKGGDGKFKVNVLKMPHHGSWGQLSANDNDLNRLIRTFSPDYAIISAGLGNKYGHPHQETLELLDQAKVIKYRTDKNGNITIISDGQTLTIKTDK